MPHFDWDMPYPSRREPILAKNVVCTSQPLAAQAGLDMLRAGGNAIDAAVATAIALTVVEPVTNGIGADSFALVWAGGGLHGLNGSGRSPAAMTADRYAGQETINQRGWDGVTVPGAVSAWKALSEKFGRLPFGRLFEPAIGYARNGYLVSHQTSWYWERGVTTYASFPDWQNVFAPDGRAPAAGEQWKSEDHARTLEIIADTGTEAFYRGELAKKIAAHARATGGMLTEDDLASHQPEWVRPIDIDYHGFRLHEIPPNGQGLVALLALGMLRHHRLEELEPDSPEAIHLQIEAMKLAFADGRRFIADPAYMDADLEQLLDSDYLEQRAQLISSDTAADPGHGEPIRGGTVLLTAADADGNMVSYIQSNYTGFGSGVVIPGTGIAMQNRGCCFTLEDGHPNQVGPNKRPYHTIIPAFVTRDDQPLMAYGVMGGFMQPQGHQQVFTRLVSHRQNPQAALDAPRYRVDQGYSVFLEPGFSDTLYGDLRRRGHDLTIAAYPQEFYGRGQAIYRLDDGYLAASDSRADGQAVGY